MSVQSGIRCDQLVKIITQLAPEHYGESWDNLGLQLGDRGAIVTKVMVALGASDQVVAQAVAWGADFLLTHHPLIFKPLSAVTADSAVGRTIRTLIKHDINLYCAHTSLDVAEGGVNDVLAEALGLVGVTCLSPTVDASESPGTMPLGIGRLGHLPETLTLTAFLTQVRQCLAVEALHYVGQPSAPVRVVALCGGSGAAYLALAQQKQADVYLTGDVKFHDAQLAQELGIAVVDAGHFATEHLVVAKLVRYLESQLVGTTVQVKAAQGEQDFLRNFAGED